MLSNGAEGPVDIARVRSVDLRSLGSGASNPAATWKGFLISESKSTVSKLTAAGMVLVGGICTGVGIEQRSPAIYITFPIMTVLAEAFYFGLRAYHYFTSGNHNLEDLEQCIGNINTEACSLPQMVCSSSTGLSHERTHLLETKALEFDLNNPIALLQKFESLWEVSLSILPSDIDRRVELLQDLKKYFSEYFNSNSDLQKQWFIKDDDQCKAVFEGICKHFDLSRNKVRSSDLTNDYEKLLSVDNGDCLYDSIWQGISDNKRRELFDTYFSELGNEEWSKGDQRPEYDILKVVLLETLEVKEHLKGCSL
ncbi:hypothetical protein [Endozoicomonas sp.]|uniref:hypothetical protein n=1 Tax=Endozoicomonas sp. TaxID=1892382 RepID=UPI003AF8C3E7